MSVFTSLGIIIIAMLIMALLQLSPGAFLLLRHYASGKYSSKKASDLALFYIIGAETAVVIFLLSFFCIINAINTIIISLDNAVFYWFMSAVFAILCFAFFFCYYRRGAGTKLFISRTLANQFDHKAKIAKSRSDAFMLGLASTIPETIFTIPIFIISTIAFTFITHESVLLSAFIILFAISAILPLVIYNIAFNIDHNLANLLKLRFKNKIFIRFFVSLLYLLLSIIIIIGIANG